MGVMRLRAQGADQAKTPLGQFFPGASIKAGKGEVLRFVVEAHLA